MRLCLLAVLHISKYSIGRPKKLDTRLHESSTSSGVLKSGTSPGWSLSLSSKLHNFPQICERQRACIRCLTGSSVTYPNLASLPAYASSSHQSRLQAPSQVADCEPDAVLACISAARSVPLIPSMECCVMLQWSATEMHLLKRSLSGCVPSTAHAWVWSP